MSNLPFPRHLEEKTSFFTRFQSSPVAGRLYPAFPARHAAAHTTWERAKGQSEVSFEGKLMSFMMFPGER